LEPKKLAQITDQQRIALVHWATPITAIDAVWLFGSRARDEGRPDSDYDIALELAPAKSPDDDEAFTEYFFHWRKWKCQIIEAVGSDVSLIPHRPGWTKALFSPRIVELWRRANRDR